jgi:Beta-L-arabinofuranosidase, GH127
MNAFVASPDLRFIAHQFLVPAEVTIPVTGSKPIHIISDTHYPFDEKLGYKIETDRAFDFYIRIPEWATKGTTIDRTSNNEEVMEETIEVDTSNLYKVAITPGTTAFTVTLNAEIRVVPRPNNAVAIYRGALLYAMEIPHKKKVGPPTHFAEWKPLPDAAYSPKLCDVEYRPTEDWRVAIDPSQLHFHRSEVKGNLPNPVFASGAPPVYISVVGTKISNWPLEGDCAGLPPANPAATGKPFGVKLVPFASAKLHISEFPVVDLTKGKVNLKSHRPRHCVLM